MSSRTRGGSLWIKAWMLVFLCAALVAAPTAARAQQNQTGMQDRMMTSDEKSAPSPILVIYKEDVKAGRTPAHDQLEANYARTYSRVPGAKYYLAMNAITGPNQAWFVQPYGSLEEVAKEFQASQQAPVALRTSLRQIAAGEIDNLTDQKAITTIYREDLSFNATMTNLPQSRYVEVVTYNVRPGHEAEFGEAAKLVRSAYEKANIPMVWATYEVFAGAPSGTYYVFRAIDSLAKVDPTNRERMQAIDAALGDEGDKRLMQLVSEGQITREINFFAFNPQTSFAPPSFASADKFWALPNAQMASVGTSGKTAANKTTAKSEVKKDKK